MKVRSRVVRVCTATLLILSPGAPGVASGAAPDRVRVAASGRYDTGRVRRFALGGGYRDLWKAEIELPVLDLHVEGGGLTPARRFGGLQTAVLGFTGQDGRLYTFRGTDKDPSAVLDPLLHDTVVQSVVQDQMAAQHPGGPLAAAVISEAAGVLTIQQRMVVMPDDPILGKFRDEFAGMVGSFYEYPTPSSDVHEGFQGAIEIIDYEALYARLASGQDDEVDVPAFLRARLLDLLIGDFDRHRKQWRWARLEGERGWQPIPEDRDMAFVRYDGVGPRVAYLYVPILQRYGPDYPWIKGLTLHGWEQDRWLLPKLSWAEWEPIARDMQGRITDDVIEKAIAALPPEYAAIDGDRLRRDLSGRRDRLLEGARSFYEHLAGEVDVQASDATEDVSVVRALDGSIRVEVRKRGTSEAEAPAYHRTFDPDETHDVRVYLRGGDDVVTVKGPAGSIRMRIIAGEGNKVVDDREGGGTRIYAESGSVEVLAGPGTRVDRRAYQLPESDSGFVDVEDVPPRDWGSDIIPFPVFGFENDVGAFLGLGALYTRYGFRKHPWSSQHRVSAGWASEANQSRVNYAGSFRPENSKLLAELDLRYSGIEVLRFYGFGNNTDDNGSEGFFRVRNEQFRVAPGVSLPFPDKPIRIAGGPWLEYSRTKNGSRFIDVSDPYGSGRFGSVGAFASFEVDTRESLTEHSNLALPFHVNPAAGYPTGGVFLELTSQVSPPIWDVERTWGSVEGSVSGFLSAGEGDRVTFGLRIGGKRTFGKPPYYAAAYIGGGEFFSGSAAVRGYRAQRFAGDGSVFGNADLRVFLTRLKLLVPGDLGVLGFGDVGRVFEDGESSRRWHPSWGGGLWFSPLARTNAISFSVANSPEETLFYLRLGFHY
jgi:hypothetical protein